MKPVFFLLFVFCSLFTRATNYYVNPSSDSTKEKGSIDNPWKTIASVNVSMKKFKAGDTIFLKRGELYFDRLVISCSGTVNAPIVFTYYGSAASKPVFIFKAANAAPGYESIRLNKSQYVVIDGFEITDDTMDPEGHAHTANVVAAIDIDASSFISIKNMDISLVGTGVSINGDKNLVDKCNIKNLRMIRNTVGGSDDYGANAIVISGADNTISNCFFKDCWGNSFDYTFYGGVIKISGTLISNNKIQNNTAINCDGFMEIAGMENASLDNILVLNNNIINCDELVYVGAGGKYKINVNNLEFQGNNIINTISRLPSPPSMISIKTGEDAKGIVNLQDNIFWITSALNIANESQVSAGQLVHENNIYYMISGKLNFRENESESVINKDAELLKKLASKHPNISNIDQLPFLYLLKYADNFTR
ncbi:MAG: hypothetical protein QM737_20650 [Ferruginibacter sp.]